MDTKRQKIDHNEKDAQTHQQRTEFLSVNNDCIFKVFEYLELDDLCAISDSCKKLKMLSSDYFQRKHQNKLKRDMRIVAIDGNIQLLPNERCVWSFSRCFDKVIVNVDTRVLRNIFVNWPLFIRENCNEYLSTIQFVKMFLCHSIGDQLVDILENVETVAFSACDLESTYHQILKHCPNLKYLSVDERFGHKTEQLLLETYPKLEHFTCLYYGRVIMTKNLKIFLRQHHNLKRLTWCFHARIREATLSDKTLECIEMIVSDGSNLRELLLSFDGTYNLEAICDKLTALCDRNHFGRLELDFRSTTLGYEFSKMLLDHGHHLLNLKTLSGLHLSSFSDYGSHFLPTLSKLENLRILQLDIVAFIKRFNYVSFDGMSNLEELHIGKLVDFRFVQKFICEATKLRLVSIWRCRFAINRLDLPMLNIKRKRLVSDGGELTIYLDALEPNMYVDESDEDDVVRIEFVEFQIGQFNLINPFLTRVILKE